MEGAFAKTKKATNILRPAIDVTFDKDAESEVFFEVWVPEVRFFFIFYFFSVIQGRAQISSLRAQIIASIAGLRMFVA